MSLLIPKPKPFVFCRTFAITSKLVVLAIRDLSESTPQYCLIHDKHTRDMLEKVATFLETKTGNNETLEQNIYVASTLVFEFSDYIVPINKIKEFNTNMMSKRGFNDAMTGTAPGQSNDLTETYAKKLVAPWSLEDCALFDQLLNDLANTVKSVPAKPLFGSFLTDLISNKPETMKDDLRFGIAGVFTMFGSVLELVQELLGMDHERRVEADFLFEPKMKAVLRQFKDQKNEKRRLLERAYKEAMKIPVSND